MGEKALGLGPTYRIIYAEKPRWVNSQSNPTESNSDPQGYVFIAPARGAEFGKKSKAIRTFEWGILADQIRVAGCRVKCR